ncbi:MAG: N4-gp56 family major capsid protein [bacterium]|nr:N4-gp56 family major capsid protein [bacterium]
MTWYDDFGAGTYETKTTTVGAGQNTYYSKEFLDVVKNILKLVPFGQRRPLPEGEGKAIQFFRWLNIAVTLTSGVVDAKLTEGVNPNATKLYGQDLSATIAEYGAFAQISSLMQKSHIDGKISKGISGMVDLFGEHAATIMDLVTMQEVVANGSMAIAADLSTTSTYSGTVTTATSTTSFADTALASNTNYGDANDDLNQSIVTFTSGTAYGQSRPVTDYATVGGVITIPALDEIMAVGDTFVVTTPDEITTGDDLSYENLKRARTNLKKYHAPFFPGGYYVALIDPDAASDLMDDTKWINVHTYAGGDNRMGMFDGEIGKFAGVRCIEHTDPFKFPIETRGTAGTGGGVGAAGINYSATGAVTSNLVLGQHAFGVTTFRGISAKQPPIIVKTPGPGDTSNPLNRYGTVGWAIEYVAKALNPLFAQQIWTKA